MKVTLYIFRFTRASSWKIVSTKCRFARYSVDFAALSMAVGDSKFCSPTAFVKKIVQLQYQFNTAHDSLISGVLNMSSNYKCSFYVFLFLCPNEAYQWIFIEKKPFVTSKSLTLPHECFNCSPQTLR